MHLKVGRHLEDVVFQVDDVRLDPPVQLVHRGGQGVVQSLDTEEHTHHTHITAAPPFVCLHVQKRSYTR